EEGRDDGVAAVLAFAGEVERREPVVALVGGDAIDERTDDGGPAVGGPVPKVPEQGKEHVVGALRAAAIVVEAAEERRAVGHRRLGLRRLLPLEPQREERAKPVLPGALLVVGAVEAAL